eukprot:scaffold33567_cov44-Phaeocystis_antarctica.AAC.2
MSEKEFPSYHPYTHTCQVPHKMSEKEFPSYHPLDIYVLGAAQDVGEGVLAALPPLQDAIAAAARARRRFHWWW